MAIKFTFNQRERSASRKCRTTKSEAKQNETAHNSLVGNERF